MVNSKLKTRMEDIAGLGFVTAQMIIDLLMAKLDSAELFPHPSGSDTDQLCLATNLGRNPHPRLSNSYILLSVVYDGFRYQQAAHRIRFAHQRMLELGRDWEWDFTMDICHDCHNKWCQDVDHYQLRSHTANVQQTMFASFLYSYCSSCLRRHYICQCPQPCQRTLRVLCSECLEDKHNV